MAVRQLIVGLGLALCSGAQGAVAAPGCGVFLPKKDQTVASGRVGYPVSESRVATETSVAKALRGVFEDLAKHDEDFRGFRIGEVDNVVSVTKRSDNTAEVLGVAAKFVIQWENTPGAALKLTVCGTDQDGFTISVDGQLKAQQADIARIAQRFLRGQEIEADGTKIWPREGSQQ